jgi:hypothetical protein
MGSLVDDELEEGEIREVEERSIVHFQNTLPFLDDFEEGEMRHKNVEGGEVMVSVQNAPAYFDDLEEGEIRDETDPFFVAVPCDQGPMVAQDVITVMELPPSKEITVREKACLKFRGKGLEIHVKRPAALHFCHKERVSSKADNLNDHTKDPEENSLLRQVEEVCNARVNELLSLQYLENKKFKLLKNMHKMEFEAHCSAELSIQDFKILDDKFEKHMKAQHRTLIAKLIKARNKEDKLKEQWLQKVREGTLEESFCEIPLPSSGFKMEKIDYGAEMEDLVKNRNSSSDDIQLDVVNDERSSGSETLHEGKESDYEIAEVSQCNDNALNGTSVDPKGNLKTPSISTPGSSFECEDISEEKNERGCNETVLGVPETRAENLNLALNPNSSQVIMPNSNFESDEGTLEGHEPACIGTISIGLAETIRDPVSNTNSLPGIVHSDEIVVAADSTSHASTRSQEHQVMCSYVVLIWQKKNN